jgi:polysaccharide export outer membrane protein
MLVLALGSAWIGHASATEVDAEYRIGPTDVLEVIVYGQPGIGGTLVVSSGGTINFAIPCGPVPVADHTVSEAEDLIEAALRPDCFVDPQVSVRIAEFRSRRVEVLGAIAKPGLYFLEGETTVRSVIAKAGGVQLEHSAGRVVVTREGGERTSMTFEELEGEAGLLPLRSGDVVAVEEGLFVFVTGEVDKPGAVVFTSGLTVTEALARAGDASPVANLGGAYVLRGTEKIALNLRRIRRGKAADFLMEPGDKLFVPESPL